MDSKKTTKKKTIVNVVFSLLASVIFSIATYGILIDKNFELSGVIPTQEDKETSFLNFWNGEAQQVIDNNFANSFGGRKFLIRLRNQVLYSFFNISSNSNVVIGKDKYLFEPNYINFELGIYNTPIQDITSNINKIVQVDEMVRQSGKELYVFVTPSKAYYCKDKISNYYFTMDRIDTNDYERFSSVIETTNLKYIDSRDYINTHANDTDFKAPFYYSTGIHWSSSWGHLCTRGLVDLINQNGKWDLGELKQVESSVSKPIDPDADLYNNLNLLLKPRGKYYKSELVVTREGQHPKVFYRGGSFMGQSLNALIQNNVFSDGVHFENSYVFKHNYTELQSFSNVNAYDEYKELKDDLRSSDIIILEINEASIYRMTFGFVDYLLANPDIFA